MANQDLQHLSLQSIFHYIVGGLLGILSCLPVIHIVIGILFIVAPNAMASRNSPPPPPAVGWLFAVLGTFAVIAGWTLASSMFLAGWFLSQRKHYYFCFVVAAVSCLFAPKGTVLGVFTIIVLSRPSVKTLFGKTD